MQDDDRLAVQDALGEALDRGDEHVAAVEHRDRHQVEHREVQVDEHREPEHAADVLGDVVVGLRDRDHGGQLLHLDVGAAVEETSQRGEGRLHDARAGLPGVAVGHLRLGHEVRADLGVFDRLAAAHLGVAEGEIARVAVGALPIDREVARGAGAGFLQVFEGADGDDLRASVDLVDDRAGLERLGQGRVIGRDAQHHQLVADGGGIAGEEVLRGREDDELVAVLLFAVGDDAHRVHRGIQLGRDDDLEADAAFALDEQRPGLGTALAEQFSELDRVVERLAVDGKDAVAGLQAGLRGRRIRGRLADDDLGAGLQAGHADLVSGLGVQLDAGRLDDELEFLAVALDLEGGGRVALRVLAVAEHHRLGDLVEVRDRVVVDGEDLVAGAQAGLVGRTRDRVAEAEFREVAGAGDELLGDVADDGGGGTFGDRHAGEPEDEREHEGEDDVEDRAHDRDDHLVGVGDLRELLGLLAAGALDAFHLGELGQGDVAAERDDRDAVVDAVLAGPAEEARAEADREALDLQAALTGGEEVAELVDEDRAAEEDGDEGDALEGAEQVAERKVVHGREERGYLSRRGSGRARTQRRGFRRRRRGLRPRRPVRGGGRRPG